MYSFRQAIGASLPAATFLADLFHALSEHKLRKLPHTGDSRAARRRLQYSWSAAAISRLSSAELAFFALAFHAGAHLNIDFTLSSKKGNLAALTAAR